MLKHRNIFSRREWKRKEHMEEAQDPFVQEQSRI